jgi:hypothetical protein
MHYWDDNQWNNGMMNYILIDDALSPMMEIGGILV